MQEKSIKAEYIDAIKEILLSRHKTKKKIFFFLLKHFTIKELKKKFSNFNELKNFLLLNVDRQEVFEQAIWAVQMKKLDILEFLIAECQYDFTNTRDQNEATLLHEACFIGDEKIITFLLKNNFDPNAQDSQGDTPVYRVLLNESNTQIIGLLQNHKAALNIINKHELSPLFTARLLNNFEAVNKLCELGVKKSTKCGRDELNYFRFSEKVERGEIRNSTPNTSFEVNLPSPHLAEDEITKKYYLALLSSPPNEKLFKEVNTLIKKQEKVTENQMPYLIDTLILTSKLPFKVEIFIQQLLNLFKEGKLTAYLMLLSTFKISGFFSKKHQVEIVSKLNEFILDNLDKLEISAEEKGKFYHTLARSYTKVGLFLASEKYLHMALEILPEQGQAQQTREEILFDLGCIKGFLLKPAEALKNFKEAFNCNPNDEENFAHYLIFLLKLQNYQEALKICEESKFDEYKKIYIPYIAALTGNLPWSESLEIINKESFSSFNTTSIALTIKTDIYLKLSKYKEAIEYAKQSFSLSEKEYKKDPTLDISEEIFTLLNTYIQAGEYHSGLELAQRLEEQHAANFASSILCNGAASVLYLMNKNFDKAEILIQKISKSGINPEVLCHFYLLLATEVLAKEVKNEIDHDVAMKYIDLALVIKPDDFQCQFYKLLLCVLKKDQKNTDNILTEIKPKLLTDPSLTVDLLTEKKPTFSADPATHTLKQEENLQETYDDQEIIREVEKYNPTKIHEYFQDQKKRLLNQAINNLSSPLPSKTKWVTRLGQFEEGVDGVIRIWHPRFDQCYATIACKSLDSFLLKKFQSGLENSAYAQRAFTRKTQSGVQTINGSIIQLKAKGDMRLWTTKIYCTNNNYLVIFDQCGPHTEIKRKAAIAGKIQIIDLSDSEQKQISFFSPSSGFFKPLPGEKSESQPTTIPLLQI